MADHPKYLADFDSATAMLRALAAHLHGRDVPLLGAMPRWAGPPMRALGAVVNAMPNAIREQVYIWSGWLEAIAQRRVNEIDGDAITGWMAGLYPRRSYPAVAIGSSNGALTHLWAALGIPWLPQTFLTPVARPGNPDEPADDVAWGLEPARIALANNLALQLHHMHDPVQDRLMLRRMAYFRFKRLTLGPAYEQFLRERLEPGGTILTVECRLSWPTRHYGDRHLFQFGALGGATVDEMLHGGPRVSAYLARYRIPRTRWEPPKPDTISPEAEWGFADELRDDVQAFAERHGYRVRRIIFREPEMMSPLIADLYDWWLARRGIADPPLLVDSFILMEPHWTIRMGAIPFWMVFNKEPSYRALERYLARRRFASAYLTLFSHGVDSIGLVPIEAWRGLLRQAAPVSDLVGVDADAFPRDFGVYANYHHDLLRKIRRRLPLAHLTLDELNAFLREHETAGMAWTA